MNLTTALIEAKKDAESGISVFGLYLAIGDDGTPELDSKGKKITVFPPTWEECQSKVLTADEVAARWYYTKNGTAYSSTAIAAVMGRISGNRWCVDIDRIDLEQPLRDKLAERPYLLDEEHLYIETTQSGGKHYVWVLDTAITAPRNKKLAQAADGSTWLETRGEGGVIFKDGTPGYKATQGLLRANYSPISEDDYQFILDACRSFDEYNPARAYVTTQATQTPTVNLDDTNADVDNMAQKWMQEHRDLIRLESDPIVAKRAVRYTCKNCLNQPAISGQSGHDNTIRVASHLYHGLALPLELADALLRLYNSYCQPPWSEVELLHKITDARTATNASVPRGFYRDKTIVNGVNINLNKQGHASADVPALLSVLKDNPVTAHLKWNEQAERLELDAAVTINIEGVEAVYPKGPYDDNFRTALIYLLQKEYRLHPTDTDLDAAIRLISRIRTFFPLRDYVESLTWDGVQRLDTLDELLFNAVPNAVNRWHYRGLFRCIFARQFLRERRNAYDYASLLKGNQGVGKTETYVRIFSPRGYSWVTTQTVDQLTDSESVYYNTRGVVLVLLDEWVTDRAGQEALKSALSQTEVTLRPKYGREGLIYTKRFAVAGTTNENAFLRDSTGGRRFLITEANLPQNGSKAHDILTPEFVDQIWAEAYKDFLDNKDKPDFLRLPREVEVEAAELAADATMTDPWEPLILQYVNTSSGYTTKGISEDGNTIYFSPKYQYDTFTPAQIYEWAFVRGTDRKNPANMTKKDAIQIGVILDKSGDFRRGKVTYGSIRTRGFIRSKSPVYSLPVSSLPEHQRMELLALHDKAGHVLSIDEQIMRSATICENNPFEI